MGITRHALPVCFPGGPDDGGQSGVSPIPLTPQPCPATPQGGAESPISAVPRTLDFTSTRHRVAHSERLDFTSEKFGLYQRARFPIRQAESMVYRSYPLDSSSAS
jgi:hypothetical protein